LFIGFESLLSGLVPGELLGILDNTMVDHSVNLESIHIVDGPETFILCFLPLAVIELGVEFFDFTGGYSVKW
jgi:hypothetical protein